MVVAAPQGGSNGPPLGARPTSAVRGRFGAAAMVTTAVAAAALSFYLAKLKFPAWSFGTAIGHHQWTIPTTLVVATLTATYLSWISARLASSAQPRLVSSAQRRAAWPTSFVGAIVVLGCFWMLEEYASSVGHDKARQFEASVGRMARAAVVSPDPLGIRADSVTEERVEIAGSSYFGTSGLRLMGRSGGKVLLLPEEWSLRTGSVVVVAYRESWCGSSLDREARA